MDGWMDRWKDGWNKAHVERELVVTLDIIVDGKWYGSDADNLYILL